MKLHDRIPILISLVLCLAACGDSAGKEEALRREREALGEVDLTRSDSESRRTSLEFIAQPGWVEETPSSGMRKAQFRLPAAEGETESPTVVVFLLGGSVQENLNRWAAQFQGGGAEALQNVKVKEVANLRMHTLDITGNMLTDSMGNALEQGGQRMLSTVIEATDGAFPNNQKYFIRLHGPAETIAKWESSYYALLDSL